MGEEIQEMKAVWTNLIQQLSKQGFSFLVMGVVIFAMWSMITQNNKETSARITKIEQENKSCNDYNRQVMEGIIRDNTLIMREIKNKLGNHE